MRIWAIIAQNRMMALAAGARSFGYRNLVYLAFVASLFWLAPLLDAQALDPEDGGGLGLALSLWAAVSIAFFLTNAVLAVVAAARGRSLGPASIACGLPVLCLIAVQIAAALP
jgi:hypothetical protein